MTSLALLDNVTEDRSSWRNSKAYSYAIYSYSVSITGLGHLLPLFLMVLRIFLRDLTWQHHTFHHIPNWFEIRCLQRQLENSELNVILKHGPVSCWQWSEDEHIVVIKGTRGRMDLCSHLCQILTLSYLRLIRSDNVWQWPCGKISVDKKFLKYSDQPVWH